MNKLVTILFLLVSAASFGQRTGWQDLYTNPYYRNSIKVNDIHFQKRTTLATASTDTATSFLYNYNDTALYLFYKGVNRCLTCGGAGGGANVQLLNDTTLLVNGDTVRVGGTGSGGGSTYAPFALDTTITGTGLQTVFTIPLPALATYNLTIDDYSNYIKSFSGGTLTVTFAVAPVGSIYFHVSGSFTSTTVFNFKPKLGVLVSTGSNPNNLAALNNLGVSYTRAGQVVTAGAMPYLNFTSAGKKVFLTLNFATPVPGANVPYPTDTAAWRANLVSFLDGNSQTNVDGYNIINEPNSDTYWSGYASQYLRLYHIALNEIKKRGNWASDRGLTGDNFYYKVWEDYINRGFADSAEDFRVRAGLPPGITTWRTNPAHSEIIKFLDTVILDYNATSADSMKYVNIHFYEPANDTTATSINPLTFKQLAWYAQRATGKPVITNEYGLHNMSGSVLVQMTQAIVQLKMDYAIGYSANQNYTWVNTDGTLNAVGLAYKNYISSL